MSKDALRLKELASGGDFTALQILMDLLIEEKPSDLKAYNAFIREKCSQFALSPTVDFDALKTLHFKSYVLGAQNGSFDDYMIACEWNREPKARFWMPRRSVLEGKHGIASQIQDFIDNPESLLLSLSLAPGVGKTTLIKFLLAYIAGKWPKSANMYVTGAARISEMVYKSVVEIIENESEYAHKSIFNNGKADISAADKTLSYNIAGDFPTIGTISIDGKSAGFTRANKFFVVDDLISEPDLARSPSRLETLYYNYTNLQTSRTIGDYVKTIMLGTIWSLHDPISRTKTKHDGDSRYTFIAIPVWDECENSNFEYDHSDNYTKKKILEKKTELDDVDFSALYLQKPMEREGLVFPTDELLYYGGILPDGDPDNIIFFCDVAWGGGDYLSKPVGYIYGQNVYIHGVIFDKGDKYVTKPRVIGSILQHGVKTGQFEANTGGDEYCSDIDRMLRDDHGYHCNLSHTRPPSTEGKFARIQQYVPDIKRFYFIDDKQWFDQSELPENQRRIFRDADYKAFMTQLTSFSWSAKYATKSQKNKMHDDAPDSLAGLAEMAYGRKQQQKAYFVTFKNRPF